MNQWMRMNEWVLVNNKMKLVSWSEVNGENNNNNNEKDEKDEKVDKPGKLHIMKREREEIIIIIRSLG